MKRVWFALVMLVLVGTACEDKGTPLPENCIEVRLIDDLCGNAVLQVVSQQHLSLGQATWTGWGGVEYNNVFGTRLDCEDMENIPRDGSTFRIKLLEEPVEQDCLVCLAHFANFPETYHDIKIIQDCGESDL